MKLYTFEINVDTLETKANEYDDEDYWEEYTGFAEYEESLQSNRVYAESLVSADVAKQLVLDFCGRFSKCVTKIKLDELYD